MIGFLERVILMRVFRKGYFDDEYFLGDVATAQTDPMTKSSSVNHDLRCKSCNHARQYCKVYPTNHFVAFDIYFECTG